MDGRGSRAVAVWLYVCCALVAAMVLLGGVTRLTGSGLSIVKWEPVSGVVPPLTDGAWEREFEAYRGSPEFREVNSWMQVGDFKRIYAVEYAHRLLGRLLGLVFLVPLVAFAIRRQLPKRLRWNLGIAAVLGGLQGAVGWLMVKSGLVDAPHVSPYRLAAHLSLALVIFVLLLWTALDVRERPEASTATGPHWRWAAALAGLVLLTALWGALVAGHRAGYGWNTFPLMAGRWIPSGLGALDPWWRNPVENVLAIQFTHRWLAKLTVAGVVALWAALRLRGVDGATRRSVDVLLAAAVVQVTLGVATLLLRVPVVLGVAHQAGAVVLLAAAVVTAFHLRDARFARGAELLRASVA